MDKKAAAALTASGEKPLARAQWRLEHPGRHAAAKKARAAQGDQRKPKIPKRPVRSKVNAGEVIGLRAMGVPVTTIADTMGVNREAVSRAVQRVPGGFARIAELRDKLKGIKMERAYKQEEKLWDRLEEEVERGEAKDVDAITRALLASEKIQAAAAGEAHASGSESGVPNATELTVLVQALLSAPGGA
jgi:predicted DNA-binding protein YlxM (UPF0122 family)